ncbi:MAG TPA: hypothetical protein VES21_12135 [Nocardioidaceae bacterium]|nr:hypothetical protein [Nocardioidaceae bacterium]
MTTTQHTTRNQTPAPAASVSVATSRATANAGVTSRRVVRSEWIKFRSLRSTRYALAAVALAIIGLGVFMAIGEVVAEDVSRNGTVDALGGSLSGVGFAELLASALGVLLVTGEYSSGSIRLTFTAVPRRLTVLVAKAVVAALTVFTTAMVSTLLAFTVAQRLLARDDITLSWTAPGVPRALIGAALYLAVVSVMGVGFGWLLRSTAGALMALFAVFYLLPIIEILLPASTGDRIGPYLPSNAGSAVMRLAPGPLLEPWTGFAVFVGYALLMLAGAALVLRRRDA